MAATTKKEKTHKQATYYTVVRQLHSVSNSMISKQMVKFVFRTRVFKLLFAPAYQHVQIRYTKPIIALSK